MNRGIFAMPLLLVALVGCGEEKEAVKDELKYDFELRITEGEEGVQIILIETGDKISLSGDDFMVAINFLGFHGDWYGTPIAVLMIGGNMVEVRA